MRGPGAERETGDDAAGVGGPVGRAEADEGREAAEVWRRANWRLCTFFSPAEGEGRSLGIRAPNFEGVTPCVDESALKAAREQLAIERRRKAWRQQHGAD